jgi:pilus assembly protein CpaB
MDRRLITVLGASLLFALVISSVFYQMTARAGNAKKAEPPPEMRDIVLAAKPLSVGTDVKAGDIKMGKVPVVAFPKGAFSKPEEVIDRPVISNILVDEAILEGRLAARGSGMGLAPIIPVGMRAVTVRVNDVSGLSGFVLPGMHVDILVTGNPPAGNGTVTVTPLQNMLVLSAGTAIQADAKGNAIQAATVTLLATPEQAEMLTLANGEGRIQLVLRNGSDQNIEKIRGSHVAELYGTMTQTPRPAAGGHEGAARPRPRPVETVAAPAPPPPPPPPDQIIVIRGTQKSVEVVGLGGR